MLKLNFALEYPLKVSEQLQGTLHYLLRKNDQVVVIEAQKENFVNGMQQLAVEMIAVDRWLDPEQEFLLGALTTGNLWQFAQLNRHHKTIVPGLEPFRVPEDIDP